jgi:hypothetical protein
MQTLDVGKYFDERGSAVLANEHRLRELGLDVLRTPIGTLVPVGSWRHSGPLRSGLRAPRSKLQRRACGVPDAGDQTFACGDRPTQSTRRLQGRKEQLGSPIQE